MSWAAVPAGAPAEETSPAEVAERMRLARVAADARGAAERAVAAARDEKARLEIFKIHAKSMPLAKGVDLSDLAGKTDGYTGADIENVGREAGMSAIRRSVDSKEITKGDFDDALATVKPSVTKAYVDKIKKFAKGEANSMYR